MCVCVCVCACVWYVRARVCHLCKKVRALKDGDCGAKKEGTKVEDSESEEEEHQAPRAFLTFKGRAAFMCTYSFTPSLQSHFSLTFLFSIAEPLKFQLFVYLYQARDMYASDKSGLSGMFK